MNTLNTRREFLRRSSILASGLAALPSIAQLKLSAATLPTATQPIHPAHQATLTVAVTEAVLSHANNPQKLQELASTYTALSDVLQQSFSTPREAQTLAERAFGRIDQPVANLAQDLSRSIDTLNQQNVGTPFALFSAALNDSSLSSGLTASLNLVTNTGNQRIEELLTTGNNYHAELINLGVAVQSRFSEVLANTPERFRSEYARRYSDALEFGNDVGIWVNSANANTLGALALNELKKKNPKVTQLLETIESYRNVDAETAKKEISSTLSREGPRYVEKLLNVPEGTIEFLQHKFKGEQIKSEAQLRPTESERDARLSQVREYGMYVQMAVFILGQTGNSKQAQDLQRLGNAAMAFASCVAVNPTPVGVAIGVVMAFGSLAMGRSGPSKADIEALKLQAFLKRFSEFVTKQFSTTIALNQATLSQVAAMRDQIGTLHFDVLKNFDRMLSVATDEQAVRLEQYRAEVDNEWRSLMRRGQTFVSSFRKNPTQLTELSLGQWLNELTSLTIDKAGEPNLIGTAQGTSFQNALTSRRSMGLVLGLMPEAYSMLTSTNLNMADKILHPGVFSRGVRSLAEIRLALKNARGVESVEELPQRLKEISDRGRSLQSLYREAATPEVLSTAVGTIQKTTHEYLARWKLHLTEEVDSALSPKGLPIPVGCETGWCRSLDDNFPADYYSTLLSPEGRIKLREALPNDLLFPSVSGYIPFNSKNKDRSNTNRPLPPQNLRVHTDKRLENFADWKSEVPNGHTRYLNQIPDAQTIRSLTRIPSIPVDRRNVGHVNKHLRKFPLSIFTSSEEYLENIKRLPCAKVVSTVTNQFLPPYDSRSPGWFQFYFFQKNEHEINVDSTQWYDPERTEANFWSHSLKSFRHVTLDLGFISNRRFRSYGQINYLEHDAQPDATTEGGLQLFAALVAAYGNDQARRYAADTKRFDHGKNAALAMQLNEESAAFKILISLATFRAHNSHVAAAAVLKPKWRKYLSAEGIQTALIESYAGWTKADLLSALPYLNPIKRKQIQTFIEILDRDMPENPKPIRHPSEPSKDPNSEKEPLEPRPNYGKAYREGRPIPWRLFPVRCNLHDLVEAIVKAKIDADLKDLKNISDDVPSDRSLIELDQAMKWLAASA